MVGAWLADFTCLDGKPGWLEKLVFCLHCADTLVLTLDLTLDLGAGRRHNGGGGQIHPTTPTPPTSPHPPTQTSPHPAPKRRRTRVGGKWRRGRHPNADRVPRIPRRRNGSNRLAERLRRFGDGEEREVVWGGGGHCKSCEGKVKKLKVTRYSTRCSGSWVLVQRPMQSTRLVHNKAAMVGCEGGRHRRSLRRGRVERRRIFQKVVKALRRHIQCGGGGSEGSVRLRWRRW